MDLKSNSFSISISCYIKVSHKKYIRLAEKSGSMLFRRRTFQRKNFKTHLSTPNSLTRLNILTSAQKFATELLKIVSPKNILKIVLLHEPSFSSTFVRFASGVGGPLANFHEDVTQLLAIEIDLS